MSRTDKTRPYWVQLRDPLFKYGLRAVHYHWLNDECNLDFPMPVTRRKDRGCSWWPPYGDNEKIYGRSNWRRSHPGHDGRARAALRRLRADWLKTAPEGREDIDSTEDAPTARWLWRAWWWD